MEVLATFSDDQTALIGCFLALIVCGTIMTMGYYLGKVVRRNDQRHTQVAPTIDLSHRYRTSDSDDVRKAA